jgi:putative membrane protein
MLLWQLRFSFIHNLLRMIFVHWLVLVIAILVAAYLLPGVHITLVAAVVLAVVLGLINVFIKPILTILTLPLNIVTLGLFSLVLNAVIILLLSHFISGFIVSGFWWAFFFSILVSLINALFHIGMHKTA